MHDVPVAELAAELGAERLECGTAEVGLGYLVLDLGRLRFGLGAEVEVDVVVGPGYPRTGAAPGEVEVDTGVVTLMRGVGAEVDVEVVLTPGCGRTLQRLRGRARLFG